MEAYLAAHPLPRSWRLRTEPSGAAPGGRDTLVAVRRPWTEPRSATDGHVVAVRLLAATVPLLADTEEVASSRLRSAGGPALVPLDDVALPSRLVPVDGLYPDAPAYPLREETLLTLRSADPALAAWFRALPDAAAAPPHVCWIGAVGDMMLDRGVDRLLEGGDAGLAAVFGDTLPVLRSADLLIGNLETSVTARGAPASKAYTFRAAPAALPPLARAGFAYLSVANNHSFDYGADGFLDTLAGLRAAGIGTSGAGKDAETALEPYRGRCGDLAVRVWSLAAYPVERTGFDGLLATRAGAARPGVLWPDEETLASLGGALGAESGISVVAVHGGEEWQVSPSGPQRALYRGLADAGATLVVGSHPHVLQGIEARGRSLILYSLGNFVFPGMEGMDGATSAVIALVGVLDRRIVALRLVPVVLEGRTVRLAPSRSVRDRVLVLSRAMASAAR